MQIHVAIDARKKSWGINNDMDWGGGIFWSLMIRSP